MKKERENLVAQGSVRKLLQEIIDALSQEKPSLDNALTKTKILLYQLGEQQLANWVNAELTGYGPNDELPPYRIVASRVMGVVTNGFSRYSNLGIPISHLPDDMQDGLNHTKLLESVAGLQHLLAADVPSFRRPLTPEFSSALAHGGIISKGFHIEEAHVEIASSVIVGAVAQVKSRLLDFALEVSSRLPAGIADADVKRQAKEIGAENLFNNAIFGSNTTIVVGSHNVQTVHNNVLNDFDALAKLLREKHIPEPDIEELQKAIAADATSKDVQTKTYGPRVRTWMKGMYAKAIDASWQIELGIAGTFLADALKAYYGW